MNKEIEIRKSKKNPGVADGITIGTPFNNLSAIEPARLENETFPDYKRRQKMISYLIKQYLKGKPRN